MVLSATFCGSRGAASLGVHEKQALGGGRSGTPRRSSVDDAANVTVMSQSTPDQIIANDAFDAYKAANYPKLSRGEAFERFAISEVALRHLNLSPSEVESGIVGDTDDGGIDGFFIFLNGQEIVEASSVRLTNRKNALEGLQRGVKLDIVIVQAKSELNWDTNVIPKIQSALEAILGSNPTAASLRGFPFNDEVVEKALLLRALRKNLSMLVPDTRITVQYVTFAPQTNVDSYMQTKSSQLQEALESGRLLPSNSSVRVEYVGDAEIVTQLRTSNDFTAQLVFVKAPVRLGRAMVGLVTLRDYLTFLRKDGSILREELFAVNVRDFAGGGIAVNNAIADTLAKDTPTEFWWLNNGITILADDAADPIELEWVLTNPLIVNGLQTSNVIHAKALTGEITAERLQQTALIRVIKETDPSVREAIIAGTNNQTAIAGIQLHANEEKQLRIEEYLRHEDWFYERRRHQYRGSTTPADRIRTVTDVAQAVIAFRLLEPNTARARPGSLLNSSAGWNRVFDPDENEALFLKAVKVADAVLAYLKTSAAKTIADDSTNARHYLVSGFALRSSRVVVLGDFAKIPSVNLKAAPSTADLTELHKLLYAKVAGLDDGKIARDKIFKGPNLRPAYFTDILSLNAK